MKIDLKQFGSKKRNTIQFTPLVVEQNIYTTKIINAYIVYDLDNWPKILLNNFKLKNCLFAANKMVKNSNKSKYVYSGYGIAFDGAGLWSFGDDFARNVVIVGVDKFWCWNSSSHTDNCENNILVLGEGPTDDINGSVAAVKQKFSINFSKAKAKF